MTKEEYGICSACENYISLDDIRKGRCVNCGAEYDVWENNFSGDLHVKTERAVVYRDID